MEINPHPWTVNLFTLSKDKINPRPQYQRGSVWNDQKKRLLIDTIFRGWDVPKFYFRNSEDPSWQWEVTDGQQRLRTIWEFQENKFPLPLESRTLPQGDLSGKFYDDLDPEIQNEFQMKSFTVVQITQATDDEMSDLFLRLQMGEQLNPAEKRNAMTGNMRDFVAAIAGEPAKIFDRSRLAFKRYNHDDYLAHVTALVLHGGPANLKAADLKELYTTQKTFDVSGTKASR